MARILLVEPDDRPTSGLAPVLERRHVVMVLATRSVVSGELRKGSFSYDIVVLDITRNAQEDWAALDEIERLHRQCAAGPSILCFSTVYKGPEMHLRAERKGARFVYVG